MTGTLKFDSWVNLVTQVSAGRGRTAFSLLAPARLDWQTLDDLYYSDAFASRIVGAVPEEALRQGYTITAEDTAAAESLTRFHDRLLVRQKLQEAWTWARLYGGAGILLGADDGRDPQDPLDPRSIRAIRFLTVVDARELYPVQWYRDPLQPQFGEPEVYTLTRIAGTTSETHPVHESRVIRFDGALTNRRRRLQNAGWSESELQRVYTALQQFQGAYAAIATLLQDASQGVWAVKDLFGLMAADAEDKLKKRLAMMDMARSVGRAVLIDAEGERFERVEATFTGLPDTLDRFVNYLAGATGIPVTVLMGQAPAGLNATGDSDVRLYLDRIKSQQSNYLEPRLLKLLRVLCLAQEGPTGGKIPADLDVTFEPLYQATPEQQAAMRKTTADMDVAYITAGVLTPEEVAVSRFTAHGYSSETQVDLDARRTAMEIDRTTSQKPDTTEQSPAQASPPPDAQRP